MGSQQKLPLAAVSPLLFIPSHAATHGKPFTLIIPPTGSLVVFQPYIGATEGNLSSSTQFYDLIPIQEKFKI